MLLERLTAREPIGPDWLQPGAQVLQLELPPDRTSPSIARAAIAVSCGHWGLTHLVPTAELVVSELVTNVVRHASTPLMLVAEYDGALLTIAVADGDSGLPVLSEADPQAEGGRGVGLIDLLAVTWGVQRTTLGKLVWASLSAEPRP